MKKRLLCLIVFILLSSPHGTLFASDTNKKNSIHPSFLKLLMQYPRDDKIINPMVPRISAKQAFTLYKNNLGLFIATASMIEHYQLMGGHIIQNADVNDKLLAKLKKVKKKYIVIYCK